MDIIARRAELDGPDSLAAAIVRARQSEARARAAEVIRHLRETNPLLMALDGKKPRHLRSPGQVPGRHYPTTPED